MASQQPRRSPGARKASVARETRETKVSVTIDLDGNGRYDIKTGIGMFDHLLSQFARHGGFDMRVSANGSDLHHVVEDVALCLGKAFTEALGERRAVAVKNYLVSLGVPKGAISTVSFGKERPLDTGHNEEAWAKNRRAHFLLK